jgi:hypothetical protein
MLVDKQEALYDRSVPMATGNMRMLKMSAATTGQKDM